MNNSTIIILTAFLLVGVQNLIKLDAKKTYEKLQNAQQTMNQEDFFKYLDRRKVRYLIDQTDIVLIKIQYLFSHGEITEGNELLSLLKSQKLSRQEKERVLFNEYNIELENKDYKAAEKTYLEMKTCFEGKNDRQTEIMKDEVNRIRQIYVFKDVSLIPDLQAELGKAKDEETKSIICYRLAKLEHISGNHEEVLKYLNLAIDQTKDKAAIEKYQKMIADNSKLY